jgi:hypothetical protein
MRLCRHLRRQPWQHCTGSWAEKRGGGGLVRFKRCSGKSEGMGVTTLCRNVAGVRVLSHMKP